MRRERPSGAADDPIPAASSRQNKLVDSLHIELAGPEDAPGILALQRLCYQSEAALYDDWTIPPLTQSLDGLRADFGSHRILVARHGGEVVGSVRARLDGGTCRIGRLVVDRRLRRQGIGTRLMAAIEREFADAERFEVFTGHLSAANLRLYRRLGYVEVRRAVVSPRLTLVFLQKAARRAADKGTT